MNNVRLEIKCSICEKELINDFNDWYFKYEHNIIEAKCPKCCKDSFDINIATGDSFTADYIKRWCDKHRKVKFSFFYTIAYELYNKYWSPTSSDFKPKPNLYYRIKGRYKETTSYKYVLMRDEEKNARIIGRQKTDKKFKYLLKKG